MEHGFHSRENSVIKIFVFLVFRTGGQAPRAKILNFLIFQILKILKILIFRIFVFLVFKIDMIDHRAKILVFPVFHCVMLDFSGLCFILWLEGGVFSWA